MNSNPLTLKNNPPDYSFQKDLVAKTFEHLIADGGAVLAAGCGAGKTNMAIDIIDKYLAKFPNAKVLVLTHGQSALRTQFAERLKSLRRTQKVIHTFRFRELTKDDDSRSFGRDSVIISLPQTLRTGRMKEKIDLLVVDEAHNYYLQPMVQGIIKRNKPDHQLLLTGTPSCFVKNKTYPLVCISSAELLEHGVLSDPDIRLFRSSYDWTLADYTQDGELRKDFKFSTKQTKLTLDELMGYLSRLFGGQKNWASVDKRLGKTFFACRNQKQAKDVHKYLTKQGIESAISTSDTDEFSEEIQRFVSDPKLKVLIVARRGVLGFNLESLANVIDLTGSHNPDRIYQLLSRVVRRDDSVPKKLFIKVTPTRLADWTYAVMCFTVALSTREYLESYDGSFTTKSIPVPKEFLSGLKNRSDKTSGPRRTWPPELPTFTKMNQAVKGHFVEYAHTTISYVVSAISTGNLPHSYWTKERCRLEALKYDTKSDFMAGSAGAYTAAVRKGWIDEICAHMRVLHESWTKERCAKEARKYKTRIEFKRGSNKAYNAACNRGWLDEICAHMNAVWTKKECAREAKKYSSRDKFYRGSCEAYNAARKNGWLDEICAHMKTRKNWTDESCAKEARKHKTQGDFRTKSPGGYAYARKNALMDKICSHMKSGRRDPWTKKDCAKEAKKYKTRSSFMKGSAGAYTAALRKGWLDEICAHMKDGRTNLWTKERCAKEARKYKTRGEFALGCICAYNAARKNGWLDEICAHMRRLKHKWDKKSCAKEAKKYKTRMAFKKGSSGAYKFASKKGWLVEICAHMKKQGAK